MKFGETVMRIEEIDKNLALDGTVDKEGLSFYSFEDKPFKVYGDLRREEDGLLYRLPKDVAKNTSAGVLGLASCNAGGRVRFKTNSKRIAIVAKYDSVCHMPHCALSGSAGLDMYVGDEYAKTFIPPVNMPNKVFEAVANLDGGEDADITINLPLYSKLTQLYIGIEDGASLLPPTPYKHECPIVYYGSSITQGGCASRPGSAYQSRLTRWLDWDHINLGFSGSAHAEEAIVNYIADMNMSVFVCDYDHNAPNPEFLERTHMPFYRRVREKNPDLPIVFMTRPNSTYSNNRLMRREIIKRTYDTAVSEGDKNVYFLDPTEHMPFESNEGTVDLCHPTDLGFYFMATGLLPILKEIEKKLYKE